MPQVFMIYEEAPEIQLYLACIISQYLITQPCHKEQEEVAEHSAYARAKPTKSQSYQTHSLSVRLGSHDTCLPGTLIMQRKPFIRKK